MREDQTLKTVWEIEDQLSDAVFFRAMSQSDLANALVPVAQQIAVSNYINGYIKGKGIGDHRHDIVDGFNKSSCSKCCETEPNFETPEQYRSFKETEWGFVKDAALDYIDRWEMYADMFDQIERIEKLSDGKYHRWEDLPDGTYSFSGRASDGTFRETFTIRR